MLINAFSQSGGPDNLSNNIDKTSVYHSTQKLVRICTLNSVRSVSNSMSPQQIGLFKLSVDKLGK